MHKPLNKTTRMALLISGGIDTLLGACALLIGFGLLPVDIARFGLENWHASLLGGILFLTGAGVIAYILSRNEI